MKATVKQFRDFNCTIQELKPSSTASAARASNAFQLHHTGIKTICPAFLRRQRVTFQLHHTGIKTEVMGRGGFSAFQISIAPYRN